jgi:anthranilate phosphoribosyltransferase
MGGLTAVTSVDASLRHHRYEGFRATIKTVGTGPRGSRALTFEEARAAMATLLAGEVSDTQAGAFLVAMRIKGEEPDELAGIAAALRDAAPRADAPAVGAALGPGGTRPLVACAGAYDGCADAPHLSLAVGVAAAACGAGVVMHCGDTLGPKYGTNLADVLAALGGPAAPSLAESAAMLERSGACVVHTGVALPGWRRLAGLRDEIGLRGPVHSAEKLIDWFGARRFVVGHTHGAYAERLTGALARLGAVRAVAVRGIEGSDVMRPGRPVAFAGGRALELPELLGARLQGDAGAEASAWLTRVVVRGEGDDTLAHTVALSAGVRLYAAGLAPSVIDGARDARASLGDGRAAAALDAMLAA